ncbi:uncharacterized protein LOC110643577 isoform X3 [Hevea brasiliensis]|uniref:uncharacterized protein LOC110643577 isoform X3 n=1 Tax=Hevea brasiliensis TaxID=3981 RepID=UPI0025F444E9|nr:uncharacterized protein LOC110643577 isoform X3 [Hevea brasiliensis]
MDEVMTVRDAVSSGSMAQTTSSFSSSSSLLPNNLPLLSAFLTCALAQFLKLFTNWFKEKRWDSKSMLGSGGMPSSHSATVTALALSIGLQEGTGSPAFAIAVVLACVVCAFFIISLLLVLGCIHYSFICAVAHPTFFLLVKSLY